ATPGLYRTITRTGSFDAFFWLRAGGRLTHLWPRLSRARTLIFPLFFLFFEGLKRRLGESRRDVAWMAPRGWLIMVTVVRATAPSPHTTPIGARPTRLCLGLSVMLAVLTSAS